MDSRVFWLALAAFVGAIEGGLIAGLLPLISADMGVSLGQAGLLVLFYSLAYAFGPPLLALLLGGVGRRRILAGAEAGLALSALLMVLVSVFEGLVVVRTVLAVVAGTYTGTAMATAAMIAPEGRRGRYMQVISMGQAIAALAGVPLGALVAAQFGWRVVYVALSIMAALAALALYLKLPRGMPGDRLSIGERLRVLRNPGIGAALLSTLIFMIGSAPMGVYVAALMAAVNVGYEALPHVPAGLALPTLMLTVGAQGFVVRTYSIAVASHVAQIAPGVVPVAISLNMSAFMIGMAVAAALGGIVVDHWGAMALPLIGVPLVVASLLVWRTVPDGRG